MWSSWGPSSRPMGSSEDTRTGSRKNTKLACSSWERSQPILSLHSLGIWGTKERESDSAGVCLRGAWDAREKWGPNNHNFGASGSLPPLLLPVTNSREDSYWHQEKLRYTLIESHISASTKPHSSSSSLLIFLWDFLMPVLPPPLSLT